MMANNGVGGDPLSDRKGFLIGIEAAKELDLPITIICPGSNKQFFDHHNLQWSCGSHSQVNGVCNDTIGRCAGCGAYGQSCMDFS
jgi:hypothetical protein